MPLKSLWGLKTGDAIARKRLRFVHFVWMALVAASAWVGWSAGMARVPLLIGVGIALIPGCVGVFQPRRVRDVSAGGLGGEPYLVIAWTLAGFAGVLAMGGAASPVAIVLVVAPVIALLLNRGTMAGEAAIFGVLAYFVALLMGRFGLLPPAVEGASAFAAALSLSALVAAALFIGASIEVQRLRQRAVTLAAAAVDAAEVDQKQVQAKLAAAGAAPDLVTLPEQGGALLLDVDASGRVRGYSGDHMGLTELSVGAQVAAIFSDVPDSVAQHASGQGSGTVSSGRRVRAMTDLSGGRLRVLLLDQSDAVAAAALAERRIAEADAEAKGRTTFFASLGHDLRTPLNAILGYADMMRAGIRGPMPEAYADYPEIIHESGRDLELIIEDILDLAKADANAQRMEPEPVDLIASGQSVLRQMEGQAERRDITLTLGGDDEVWADADPRAVRQIWQNLVSNAVKYSSRGGRVVLGARTETGSATLTVVDTGAGMSAADLARALEPFSQGANAKGHMGTGLGLAVVKRFAELHGGAVHIDSKEGKGTRVEVTLPLADPADIIPLDEAAE